MAVRGPKVFDIFVSLHCRCSLVVMWFISQKQPCVLFVVLGVAEIRKRSVFIENIFPYIPKCPFKVSDRCLISAMCFF